jgi:hypothetical protein
LNNTPHFGTQMPRLEGASIPLARRGVNNIIARSGVSFTDAS